MKIGIGIDPGLTETGMVAIDDADEDKVLASATFSCTDTGSSDVRRVLSLAERIVDTLVEWLDKFDTDPSDEDYSTLEVDISIELPVMGRKKGELRNPQAFAKQMRLIQEIETGILFRVAGECKECWVTEVYPATSKTMATNYGQASKEQILAASPFKDMTEVPLTTRKTLADAWAHALCTWKGAPKPASRANFTELKAVEVKNANYKSP